MMRRRELRCGSAGGRSPAVTARALAAAAVAAGAMLGGACGVQFRPSLPMRAQSNDVTLELKSVRVGLARNAVLESRSTAPHVLRRGWLTVPTRAPCSGGANITDISVDGGGPDGFLPPGVNTLRLAYDDTLDSYTLDAVADLETDDGACLRVPVLSQSVPMEPAPRFVLALGVWVQGGTELAGVESLADVHVGA